MDYSRFQRSQTVEYDPAAETPWYLRSFLPALDNRQFPNTFQPNTFRGQLPPNAMSAAAGINDIPTTSMLRQHEEDDSFSRYIAAELAKLKLQ